MVFAYGAALAMTPYLLIKISWVVAALSGLLPRAEHLSVAGFVVLNTVTIGMAAAGIALALALVRPWGERIPALVVLSCAWIGCGFLVPMTPYAVLDTLLSAGDEASGSEASVMPSWEASLIQVSFLGMSVGLAVALPFYLRARWPAAFAGRVGDGTAAVRPSGAYRPGAAMIALVGALVVGMLDLYWAAGGTIGLRHPAERELTWYLQAGNTGIWSLAGAWGVWVIARARQAVPLWIPVSVSWLVSGFLVAWGCWKLPFAVYQAVGSEVDTVWPEHLGVAAAQFLISIAAGTAMLSTVLHAYRARQSPHDARISAYQA
ncbi:hypothetical protein [Dactylosporangium sp. CA-233914]|uniref:hypothetical protein n=1 Tax=Dactylosporangium sp. CA-233914 TaxID=3239934 RepID=UPI003D8E1E4B